MYADELVQEFTKAKEDLRVFSEIRFLEFSLEPLKTSYKAAEAEKKNLHAKVVQWAKKTKPLKIN